MTEAAPARLPWHFWPVVVIMLLWTGFVMYDFLMTHVDPEAYLARMSATPEMLAFVRSIPPWMNLIGAMGALTAFLGAVLLALRRTWAVWVFGAALICALIGAAYVAVGSPPARALGGFLLIVQAISLLQGVLFFAYAHHARRRGLLR